MKPTCSTNPQHCPDDHAILTVSIQRRKSLPRTPQKRPRCSKQKSLPTCCRRSRRSGHISHGCIYHRDQQRNRLCSTQRPVPLARFLNRQLCFIFFIHPCLIHKFINTRNRHRCPSIHPFYTRIVSKRSKERR